LLGGGSAFFDEVVILLIVIIGNIDLFTGKECRRAFIGIAYVGKMKEGILFEADVDERGVHTRNDLGDAAEVDVADTALRFGGFDEELD